MREGKERIREYGAKIERGETDRRLWLITSTDGI